MKKKKKIIIIGGGVSGLSAGIYALQNGMDAVIYEKNPNLGGLCTTWYRKGFPIDGCIHWLTGTNEETELSDMWKNVGAFKSQDDILYLPSWGSFEYEGSKVTFWIDIDKAEKEWLEISPEDSKMIKKFFKLVRVFNKIELPLSAPKKHLTLKKWWNFLKCLIPALPVYIPTMFVKTTSYAKKFKHPALRFALENVQPGPGNLYSMIFCYSSMALKNGGIPKGGSQKMIDRMAERFVELGGVYHVNSPVSHVLLVGDTAVGVKLVSREKAYGDYVISCVDSRYTIHKLLLNQYKKNSFEKRSDDMRENPSPSCVQLSFRVKNIPSFISPLSFPTEPFDVGGLLTSHVTIRSYEYDKENFSKNDYTLMTVLLDQYTTNFAFWRHLYQNQECYKAEKQRIAQDVLDRILKKFPNLQGNIELLDVATPMTYERYTHNACGSYMSFLFTHNRMAYSSSGRIRGLKHFYLASQWMQAPGGLPLALASGKFAIQQIALREKFKLSFLGFNFFSKKKYS